MTQDLAAIVMAHVGKPFPRAIPSDLVGFDFPWNHLPRKWRIHPTAAIGIEPNKWMGADYTSTLHVMDPDNEAMTWRFELPANPTMDYIDWRMTLVENFPSPSPTTKYIQRFEATMYDGGVAVGRKFIDFIRGFGPWDLIGGWLSSTLMPNINPIITPATWHLQFQWRWANWAEQPEYHPYRYEP